MTTATNLCRTEIAISSAFVSIANLQALACEWQLVGLGNRCLVRTSVIFKEGRGLFWDDFVILNRDQMPRTAPELVSLPSPNFRGTEVGGNLAPTDLTCSGNRRVLGWNRVSNLGHSGREET
ncbi:hypothetical protein AVEN_205174-1 [Araneus ventricosus]|uniref:Uncharacterized protein n=1 Tax=Araneus ventricosus TaxID=182803 RepID=A0A4Y2P5B6_ARAVE|nr:hypothetical protein AVEN_205174-1 [Araneus ventricosus]